MTSFFHKPSWNAIHEQRRAKNRQRTLETGENWETRILKAWDLGLNNVQKLAEQEHVSSRAALELLKRHGRLVKLRGKLVRDTQFGAVQDHFEKLFGWKGFTKCDPVSCPLPKQLPWLPEK